MVKLFLFLIWDIRQNESVNAYFLTCTDKLFCTVGVNHVCICHENHRDCDIFSQISHKVKNLVCCNSGCKCLYVGALDYRSLCCRIREWNSKFYKVCSVCNSFSYDFAVVSKFGSPQVINGINALPFSNALLILLINILPSVSCYCRAVLVASA